MVAMKMPVRSQDDGTDSRLEPGIIATASIVPTDISTLDPSDYTTFELTKYLSGWISPKGRFYKVLDKAGHWELVELLTGDGYQSAVLERHGWVHLSMYGSVDLGDEHRLTTEQVNTLMDICMLCEGTEFADAILRGIEHKS